MESKLKQGSFFIAFVCGHKDTTIFVITKIVIYLFENIKIIIVCGHNKKYNSPFTMYKRAE